ncbi:C4-dicarboxylate ABC transporter permease [Oceanispirochaeta crateris]|uniref:C4-dicarboxylate ABC transporter permease n=2 Tax=Oceanispirochaeta crateris TaxID=2518645 RepID=A0A5C1QSG0_9SPIO|nr:C4-dicarboxylate ABC transporter permease [Oceanispirochaeta crateris]
MIFNYIEILFTIPNLIAIASGTVLGTMMGAMPGLTGTLAVAILIPTTFSMDPVMGLAMMGGSYSGSMYGGSIASILMSTPGTPAALCTSFEGYPLTRKGRAGIALKVSAVSSFWGGIISTAVLLIFAPILAYFALNFGPPEYFLLAIMGLASIVMFAKGNMIKGLLSGFIGLAISLIGTDPISGSLRYTGGFLELYEGLDFMAPLIGMFSIAQMLTLAGEKTIAKGVGDAKAVIKKEKMPKGLVKPITLGSFMGTGIGILPGAGATISAFLAYQTQRQISKKKHEFGKGSLEGIAAAESSNNAVTGGSLIPLLTLGIPGNTTSAALMGGLIIQGLIPGPELFTRYADVTYPFILSLFVANVVFLMVGLFFAPQLAKVSLIPTSLLIPVVCMFSVIGTYAIQNSLFDVGVMIIFALLGYFLSKYGFSMGALVLGLILGPIAEKGFAQGILMGKGSYSIFVTRPTSIVLIAITVILIVSSYFTAPEMDPTEESAI